MEWITKPTPPSHTFIISTLIWADSKDSWINRHTHMHAPVAGPGLPHALMMMLESRAKHTHTRLLGSFKVYLLVSLFLKLAILCLGAHTPLLFLCLFPLFYYPTTLSPSSSSSLSPQF